MLNKHVHGKACDQPSSLTSQPLHRDLVLYSSEVGCLVIKCVGLRYNSWWLHRSFQFCFYICLFGIFVCLGFFSVELHIILYFFHFEQHITILFSSEAPAPSPSLHLPPPIQFHCWAWRRNLYTLFGNLFVCIDYFVTFFINVLVIFLLGCIRLNCVFWTALLILRSL